MKHSSGSKTSLFLIELIITIFFFSVASVVCVRLFLYSHRMSTEAYDRTHAVAIAQSAAESFLTAGKTLRLEAAAAADPDARSGTGTAAESSDTASGPGKMETRFHEIFDDALADEDLARFRVETEITAPTEDGLCRLLVRVSDLEGEEIYSLEVLDHSPGSQN